jgi:hypothetical protein
MNEPYYGTDVSAIEAARIQAIGAGTAALILGAAFRFGQWLVLRGAIRAAWWMPATCVGWALCGAVAGFSAGGSVSTIGPGVGPVHPLLTCL